jgi:hypothetical protein
VRFVWLERIAIALCSVALASFLIALVSGYFTGHDIAQVAGDTAVGYRFPDQGDALLSPGTLRPPYDSEPPTSGPHLPLSVRRDEAELNDNQILQALSVGDVLFVYGTRRAPRGLKALATRIAGAPFSRSLSASGLAVILVRRPGTRGVLALAWRRMLPLHKVDPILLSAFAQSWLGRGARASQRG